MTDAFLSSLLEDGVDVPVQLVQFNSEIKNLDTKLNELMKKIKEKTLVYQRNAKKATRDYKLKMAKEIDRMYSEADLISKKKITISESMCQYMDNKIADFDRKTADFNQMMARKNAEEHREGQIVEDFVPIKFAEVGATMDGHGGREEERCGLCRQNITSEELIGCDQPSCEYEWFHRKCVGITSFPSGRWICDNCKASEDLMK